MHNLSSAIFGYNSEQLIYIPQSPANSLQSPTHPASASAVMTKQSHRGKYNLSAQKTFDGID